MRQQPGTRQMATARIAPEVFARELGRAARIEDSYIAIELGLQGLLVDQPDGSRIWPSAERCRGSKALGRPELVSAVLDRWPAAIEYECFGPEIPAG